MSVPEPVPEITAVALHFWSGRNESIGCNHLSDQPVIQPLGIPADGSDMPSTQKRPELTLEGSSGSLAGHQFVDDGVIVIAH